MTRLVIAGASIVLAFVSAAQAEPLVPSTGPGLPRWRWTAPDPRAALRIDLVRADVTIVRSSDNRLSISIAATGGIEDANRLRIDVTEKNDGYVLSDRFPPRSMIVAPKECLPPPDERGDFWLISTKLRVVVAAPTGWEENIVVNQGSIHDLR